MAKEEPKKLPEINKGDSKIDIKGDMTLSDLMGDSGKGDFGKMNALLSLKYIKVRSNVLKAIIKETQGGNLKGLNIDKSINLADLLGEIPKAGLFTAFKFQEIKETVLKKVDKATKDAELELGTKIELNDLLGSTPDQDFLTKFRFFSIRQSILKKIKKAVKDFKPKFDSEAISNSLISTKKTETDVKDTKTTTDTVQKAESSNIQKAESSNIQKVESADVQKTVVNKVDNVESSDVQKITVDSSETSNIQKDIVDTQKNLVNKVDNIETTETSLNNTETGNIQKDIVETHKDIVDVQKNLVNKVDNIDSDSKTNVEKNVVNKVESTEKETFSLDKISSIFTDFKLKIKESLNVNNLAAEKSEGPIDVNVSQMPEKETDLGQVEEQKEQRKVLLRIAEALEKSSGAEKGNNIKASGGLGALGKLGKGLGEGIGQLFKGIGKGLRFLGKNFGNIMKGIVTLGALGISLIPAAKAFQEFSEVSWKGVGMGLTALGGLAVVAALIGKASGQMLIGAAAIGVLGLALLPAAKAFQMFGDVSWKSVALGFTVLAGLGVVAALLSAAVVPMLIGAAAIAVLGAALIPAAKAFQMFASAVEPVGEFINNVLSGLSAAFEKAAAAVGGLISAIATEIKELAALDGGELLATAAGITAVGAALAAFGAGGTVGKILGSIGEGFAKLFGAKSPIEQLKEIANIGPDLERSSQAIEALPKSLNKISDALKSGFKDEMSEAGSAIKGLLKDIDKGLDKIDFKKLDKVTGLIIHRVVTDTAEVADVNSQQASANAAPTIINNNVDNSQKNQSVSYSSSGVMDEGTVPAYGSYASMGSADY